MSQADEARELAREWLRTHDFNDMAIDIYGQSLATLLARHALEARLDEARWWRAQSHEGAICSPQDCTQCERIAKLAERVSKGAGGEGK
jgi:hypothetical protein